MKRPAADAHDAGAWGWQMSNGQRLMLMMLGPGAGKCETAEAASG